MPVEYTLAAKTKPARPKEGGGFESDLEAATPSAFTPMVKEAFSVGALDSTISGWWRSTYSDSITPVSGTQCNKVLTLPGSNPPSCGGSHGFGGRLTMPEAITEGYTVWQRIYMYFPTEFSFGYLYFTNDDTNLSAPASTGATEIFVDALTEKTVQEGQAIRITLDDTSKHFTHVAVGGATSQSQFTIEDPLPSPAGLGSKCYTWDEAEARECGLNADDGGTGIKWLMFTPNAGTRVIYTKVKNQRRQIDQPASAGYNYESEVSPASNATGIYNLPRNQWVALQMGVKVATDGTGWVRLWADTQLIVESLNINTLRAADNPTGLNKWGLGDYWNGVPYTDGLPGRDTMYIDECIVATDMPGYGAPTGIDPSGNVYIDPTSRVGDFV